MVMLPGDRHRLFDAIFEFESTVIFDRQPKMSFFRADELSRARQRQHLYHLPPLAPPPKF